MCTLFYIDTPESHPVYWKIHKKLSESEQFVVDIVGNAEIVLRPLGSPTWEDASKLIFFTDFTQDTKIPQGVCVLDLNTWNIRTPSGEMVSWRHYLLEHLVS